MSLTNQEKETIILFDEDEQTAKIETFNCKLKRRLAGIYSEQPEAMTFEGEDKYGAVTYTFPKSWIKINPKRILTEDEKKYYAEKAKLMRTAKNAL